MPPATRRPDGYAVIAALLALGAAISLLAVSEAGDVIFRAVSLACCTLFAVAAEALWACRPWCVRAVAAVAVVGPAAMALIALRDGGPRPDDLWLMAGVAGAGGVTVAYVRHRARRLFARVP